MFWDIVTFSFYFLAVSHGLRLNGALSTADVGHDYSPVGTFFEQDVETTCAGKSPERRLFCDKFANPRELKKSMNAYREQRSKCLSSATILPDIDFEGYQWNSTESWINSSKLKGPSAPGEMNVTSRVNLWSCKTDPRHDGFWQIYWVGPFSTFGGETWVDVQVQDIFKFSLASSKRKLITASFMGPVGVDNEVLGYPPLHVHHMHLQNSYQGVIQKHSKAGFPSLAFPEHNPLDVYTFHVHGDSMCQSASGGTDCYMIDYPSGYGAQYVPGLKFFLNGQIIDERLPNSTRLDWWMEWGLRSNDQQELKPISKLFFTTSPLSLMDTANSGGHFYAPKEDSVFFVSAPMHRSGRFLFEGPPFAHVHQQYSKGFWALSASPAEAGLDDDLFTPIRNDKLLLLQEHGKSFADIQKHIQKALAQSKRACLNAGCSYVPMLRCEGGTGLEYVGGPDQTNGRYYDRRSSINCADADWNFKAGDIITVVWFLGPVHADANGVRVPYPMHLGFGGLLLDDEVDAAASASAPAWTIHASNWRYTGIANPSDAIFAGHASGSVLPDKMNIKNYVEQNRIGKTRS